jgi:hypothetical protein
MREFKHPYINAISYLKYTKMETPIIPDEIVMNQIYYIRGQKVMIDRDLAVLYNVETRILKQAVRRNITRFPDDFMFEMTKDEFQNWRSQIVISNSDLMGLRFMPFCFTEQGVAMLSSVLNSERAINVNIQIIRIFTRIRHMFMDNTELRLEIEKIKSKLDNQDKNMEVVFRYLDELIENKEDPKPRKRIGFKSEDW